MSLIHEMLHQRLRHLLRAKKRSDDRRISSAMSKRSPNRCRYHCNQRCPGGQDPRTTSSIRLNRRASLPVGSRCIVPLLHIWLRLNEVTPTSTSVTRRRYLQRVRLSERSLLDNVRQVIRLHWNNFCMRLMPATVQTNIEMQRGKRQHLDIVRGTSSQDRFIWLQNLRKSFELISKKLESALANVGPSPDYFNTSAAMELVNLGDLIEQLNSTLIDHLINNADYAITPRPSLSQLGIF